MNLEKCCFVCKLTKPLFEFPKNKARKDGHDGRCKICNRKATKLYATAHREEVRLKQRELARREQQEHPERKLARQAKYRNSHRSQLKEKGHEWRENTPGYASRYRNEHPEQFKTYQQTYLQKHSDRRKQTSRNYNVRHHDKLVVLRRNYLQNNRIKLNIKSHHRRARIRNLPANFTVDDWQKCLDYFNNQCAVCGREKGPGYKLAHDHWIAVSDTRPDNPGTVPWNIVPLCHGINGCNNSKNNRDAQEWLVDKYGEQQARKILVRIATYFERITKNK